MNQVFNNIVNAHFPGLNDYFGNDIAKMKAEHYHWTIETLSDCANGLDARNLKDFIDELKLDPLYIMEQVIRKMEADLKQRIKDDDLCPECCSKLEPGKWEREYIGFMGNAPAYRDVATVMYCRNCGYERDV